MNVPAGPTRARRSIRWTDVAVLTVGMGVAVTISWSAFFRQLDSYSLDLPAMVRPVRLMVYGSQFLLVGAMVFWLARGPFRDRSFGMLAGTLVAAWVGEGVLLTILGAPLVANELDPEIAWYYWLVATAGPLQPIAGIVGAWVGIRPRPGSG